MSCEWIRFSIITGNPGLGGFYVDFMQNLYNNLHSKIAVWCISHAGHYNLPGVFPLKGIFASIKYIQTYEMLKFLWNIFRS